MSIIVSGQLGIKASAAVTMHSLEMRGQLWMMGSRKRRRKKKRERKGKERRRTEEKRTEKDYTDECSRRCCVRRYPSRPFSIYNISSGNPSSTIFSQLLQLQQLVHSQQRSSTQQMQFQLTQRRTPLCRLLRSS